MSGAPLTVARFVDHARKFGPECVVETARDYLTERELRGLEVELACGAKSTRQRRTTIDLVGQVIALAERGLVMSAIADMLNISDRRVRATLANSRTSENGGRKRLDQAEKNAAKADGQHPGRPGRNGALSDAHQLDLYWAIDQVAETSAA